MSGYIFRRLLGMIPTLAIISVIVFVLIQLPPGDIVTANLASLQSQGMEVSEEQIQALRAQYNLDKSMPMQYSIGSPISFRGTWAIRLVLISQSIL